jgi:hypothetical protein
MIDLVRNSGVPSNIMQFAANGALLMPAPEMVEILVHLATQNKIFGEQARLTLAGWDPASASEIAATSSTPKEVLDYFIDPENLRPVVLPLLLENPAVEVSHLIKLAVTATREQVEVFLQSPRVNGSQEVLTALLTNGHLRPFEAKEIEGKLQPVAAVAEAMLKSPDPKLAATPANSSGATSTGDSEEEVSDEVVNAFLSEHAAEIAAENEKKFQPIGMAEESLVSESDAASAGTNSPATAIASGAAAAPARQPIGKKWILSADEQRGSALQKISKLDVKGRINLAMKGNKEERSILIRDGTKIVATAVLESPKLTDGEVEKFAAQKNVPEAVLRAIPMKRRFMKLYPVVRNLTFNPRTPIDVSLGLMKNLLTQDLRHLSGNKEVSDTVRKLAIKMFRQKLDVTKK